MAFTGRVRPTRGFLLEIKRRLSFIREGYELLKMKRDELAKELQMVIPELERRRTSVEKKAKEALENHLGKADLWCMFCDQGIHPSNNSSPAWRVCCFVSIVPPAGS